MIVGIMAFAALCALIGFAVGVVFGMELLDKADAGAQDELDDYLTRE